MAKKYELFDKAFSGENIRGKTITIVGLEGPGIIIAEAAVRSGLNVRLLDRGRVYENEMHSQTLYLHEDINKFKAKQAKKRLEQINQEVKVKAFHEELTQNTIYLLDSDLVVDCTNTAKVSQLISKYCLEQEMPVIYAGVEGTKGIILTQADKAPKLIDYKVDEKGINASSSLIISGATMGLVFNLLRGKKVPSKLTIDSEEISLK